MYLHLALVADANTLASSMLSIYTFDDVNAPGYGIAVIARIIQSEMTDLLIQGMDEIIETPVQHVTQHVQCSQSVLFFLITIWNINLWDRFTKISKYSGVKQ